MMGLMKNGAKGLLISGALILVVMASSASSATNVFVHGDQEHYLIQKYIYSGNALTEDVNSNVHPWPIGLACDPVHNLLLQTLEGLMGGDVYIYDMDTLGEPLYSVHVTHIAENEAGLSGIAVDVGRQKAYVVKRNSSALFVLNWDSEQNKYVSADYHPHYLSGVTNLFGIALDELRDRLYVTDSSPQVRYYSPEDWSWDPNLDYISVAHDAVGIALDPARGYVYTGALGYGSEPATCLLSRYDISTMDPALAEKTATIDKPVAAPAVEPSSGLVFLTTFYGLDPNGDPNRNVYVYEPANLTHVGPEPPLILPAPGGLAVSDGKPTVMSLTIDANAPAGGVVPEDEYVYTFTLDPGAYSDANVVLAVRLPLGVDIIDPFGPNAPAWNPAESCWQWSLGEVSGSPAIRTLAVRVNEIAEPTGKLLCIASAQGDAFFCAASKYTDVACWGGDIIYVRADGYLHGSGTSWECAYNNLQQALARAKRGCGTTIWVAAGTYKPGPWVEVSFQIPAGVSVYGGFTGTEDAATFDVNDRNLKLCKTILSGEIGDTVRNNYVVIMGGNTLLNGIVIAKGEWRGILGQNVDYAVEKCTVEETTEDGIRCEGGNLTCTDTLVRSNGQHGIYCYGPGKNLAVHNCSISGNGWSGLYALSCSLDAKNNVIHHNGYEPVWSGYGGVTVYYGASTLIRNCTIACNANEGVYSIGGNSPEVRNCILWYNDRDDAQPQQVSSGIVPYYSCLPPRDPNFPNTEPNAVTGNIFCLPGFANTEPNLIPNLHLAADSNCIERGDGDDYPGETDIDGDMRVVGETVDIGADEAACTENVYERADLDADGIVDFFDFSILGAAWKSLDPDNCPVDPNLVDPNDFARWNAVCDFNTDHIVDMKDMGAFADGWLWVACWYKGQTELGEMMSMSQGGPSCVVEAESAVEMYDPAAEYETLTEIMKWLAEVAEEEPDIDVEIEEFMKVIQESLSELQEQLDL